jgi:3-deoxy-D-manno-octulosonic-acid transferase
MSLMSLAIRAASPFVEKARLWTRGRRQIFKRMRREIDPQADIAWFHAASLGEFEQGRPVIEAFRQKYPQYKILLTFFSPSGYEYRKNYPGADYIFYLPVDRARNARRFVEIAHPKIAVFIKYEFWGNYLKYLHKSGTRIFSISAIFRRQSGFFSRWYGRRYCRLLTYFEHIFVQNEVSRRRLWAVGVKNVTVAGDTRFDRVYDIATQAKVIPLLESFASGDRPVFIAGSTWPPDEELIARLMNESPETKFVIAPHEVREERIDHIEKLVAPSGRKVLRYTHLAPDADISGADVLIIDTIGVLSSAYRYGRYGYIGGGFGVGIHNTLEAATFGLPLSFGPHYKKFQEATDLISMGGATSVINYAELRAWYLLLRDDEVEYRMASDRCRRYVENGRGATALILSQM